jgi:hypothetical protein
MHLETRNLAPGAIDLRLGAVRRLAFEASDCGLLNRSIPDVAWDVNPNTGVAVYSKTGTGGWAMAGGTSVGPIRPRMELGRVTRRVRATCPELDHRQKNARPRLT